MSKKLRKVYYALGWVDDDTVYMNDYHTEAYTTLAQAKKIIDAADSDTDDIIFEVRPIAVAKARKREWLDVESR